MSGRPFGTTARRPRPRRRGAASRRGPRYRPPGPFPPLASALAVAALAACDVPSAGPEPAAVVRDSAGVEIVESVRPALDDGAAWRVGEEALVAIGVVEGEPAYQLSDVSGATRLEDGTVVVADGATQEVRFFDADGTHRVTAGGAGEGPGEFTGLSWLGRHPDGGVWAWDFSQRRITRLSAGGALVGSVTLGSEPAVLFPVGALPDGSFVMKQLWGAAAAAATTTAGLRRDPVAFVRIGEDGSLLDTLGLFPGREVYITSEDGRPVMVTPPFGRNAVGAAREGRAVVGTQHGFELLEHAPTGELLRVARIPSRDGAVERGRAERLVEAHLAAVAENVGEEQSRALRAMYDEIPFPDALPAYGGVMADDAGNLWVSEWAGFPRVPSRWTVLAPDGRWLTDVRLPDGFQLLDVGEDWIVGVRRDDLGVEHVEVRALVKPPT